MKKQKKEKVAESFDVYWTKRVQKLIHKNTRWFKNGHGTGDSRKWLRSLTEEALRYIRKRNKGIAYDENLALSSVLGRILVVWYCACHRAKSLDPRRPLDREMANLKVTEYRGNVMSAMSSDQVMLAAFPNQPWNFPWGKDKKGGTFV